MYTFILVLSLSPLLQLGNTPLMTAAFNGKEEAVKMLLSFGASIHHTNKVRKLDKASQSVSGYLLGNENAVSDLAFGWFGVNCSQL